MEAISCIFAPVESNRPYDRSINQLDKTFEAYTNRKKTADFACLLLSKLSSLLFRAGNFADW